MTLLDRVLATAWAIRPEALTAILALAEREDISAVVIANAMHYSAEAKARAVDRIDSVSARRGVPMDRTDRVTRRGSIAVVPVIGPIVRYGGMFTDVSGGTSVDSLARDFASVLGNPDVEAILLEIDSPGGEASGIAEFADMIYAARTQKPVWAYVSDLGASAGYWIASAAEQVVIAETAALGSIGVVAGVRDPNAEKPKQIEFVSSMSPNKRPDPTSDAGRAQWQTLVDALGEIFVGAVARNRGVSTDTVLEDYGQGGLLVGSHAVAAGLADRLGSFEGTLRDLAAARQGSERPSDDAPRRLRPAAAHGAAPAAAASATLDDQGVRASLSDDAVTVASDSTPTPARRERMSMRDRFFAWLDAEGAAETVAGADRVEADDTKEPIMAQTPSGAPAQTEPVVTGELLVAEEQQIPPAVSNRLAQLEAENARLRTARIMGEARAFAERQCAELRAMPTEAATITTLYAQLSQDDERFGALAGPDGPVLRTTLLANVYASRPSRKELTEEALGPAMQQVLMDRAGASSKRGNPDDPPTAERLAELLNLTPGGRKALADAAASQNGKAH